MIRLSVPEIEGGSPACDGEGEEGLVLEYSSSWIIIIILIMIIHVNNNNDNIIENSNNN